MLQVSFAKYRLFYRALLQKISMIVRSILIEATPYKACVESVDSHPIDGVFSSVR